MSTIDRTIQVFTATNTYVNRKLNEQILNQQYSANKHLSELRSQIEAATDINKKILENQIKVEKHKEAQKYYKSLSFNSYEIVELFGRINDTIVLSYFLNKYLIKLKSNIVEANDNLDEINDKAFNKKTLEILNNLKEKTEKVTSIHELEYIDDLFIDYQSMNEKINLIKKPEINFPEIKSRSRINLKRTIFLVVLGIVSFFMSIISIASLATIHETGFSFFVIWLVMTSLMIFGFIKLLKKEKKWRSEFEEFNNKESSLNENYKSKIKELQEAYQKKIIIEKEKLMNHPFISKIILINKLYPEFDKISNELAEIEISFENKWMLAK